MIQVQVHELAAEWVDQLAGNLQDVSPSEIRQLGCTLRRWSSQIAAWHTARVSTGRRDGEHDYRKP